MAVEMCAHVETTRTPTTNPPDCSTTNTLAALRATRCALARCGPRAVRPLLVMDTRARGVLRDYVRRKAPTTSAANAGRAPTDDADLARLRALAGNC